MRIPSAAGGSFGALGLKRAVGLGSLSVISLGAMVFCYMFLFWNVLVIYHYFFLGGSEIKSDGTGLLSSMGTLLRHWSVDLSAQTPFKLSLFATLIFYACVRSLTGSLNEQELRARAGSLPFFRSLETTFVQLGLAGSIWGFLVIGSTIKHQTNSDNALQILLDAFGTALLSTFTGVILAFVAAPLMRGLWRWLHDVPATPPNMALGLTAGMDRLKRAMDEATGPANRLGTSLEQANAANTTLQETLGTVTAALEAMAKRLNILDLAPLTTAFQQVGAEVKTMRQSLESAATASQTAGGKLDQMTGKIERLEAHAATSATTLARLADLTTSCSTALTAMGPALTTIAAAQQATATSTAALLASIEAGQGRKERADAEILGALERLERTMGSMPAPASGGFYPPPSAGAYIPPSGPPPEDDGDEYEQDRPRRRSWFRWKGRA